MKPKIQNNIQEKNFKEVIEVEKNLVQIQQDYKKIKTSEGIVNIEQCWEGDRKNSLNSESQEGSADEDRNRSEVQEVIEIQEGKGDNHD